MALRCTVVCDCDGPLQLDLQPDGTGRIEGFFAMMSKRGIECCYRTHLRTGDFKQAITDFDRGKIDPLWADYCRDHAVSPEPTPGASDVVGKIADVQWHVATARGASERDQTTAFLAEHFGSNVFGELHMELNCKADVVSSYDPVVFIEDTPGIACNVARNTGATVLLFPAHGACDMLIPDDCSSVIWLAAAARRRGGCWRAICQEAWKEAGELIQAACTAAVLS